jgi:hypothetical protein
MLIYIAIILTIHTLVGIVALIARLMERKKFNKETEEWKAKNAEFEKAIEQVVMEDIIKKAEKEFEGVEP